MWMLSILPLSAFLCCMRVAGAQGLAVPANPAIDPVAFLLVADQALGLRDTHRLSEDEFIAFMGDPATVVLDARSTDKYAQLHVKGAVNLPFSDIAISTLAQALPDRATRVLIYCNNNFTNAEDAFPSKLPSASLNLSTFVALYDYGYRNVYELGPLIDARTTRIPLQGSADSTAK
jgi:phage shock protein E